MVDFIKEHATKIIVGGLLIILTFGLIRKFRG